MSDSTRKEVLQRSLWLLSHTKTHSMQRACNSPVPWRSLLLRCPREAWKGVEKPLLVTSWLSVESRFDRAKNDYGLGWVCRLKRAWFCLPERESWSEGWWSSVAGEEGEGRGREVWGNLTSQWKIKKTLKVTCVLFWIQFWIHSIHLFLPFHWPRTRLMTNKWLPTENALLMHIAVQQ